MNKISVKDYINNTQEAIDEINNTRILGSLQELKEEWLSKLNNHKINKRYDIELILMNIDNRHTELSLALDLRKKGCRKSIVNKGLCLLIKNEML